MPVRIYDIAKKLGIERKEVLAKAKSMGITAAKVPSSSLDKITAEFLELEMGGKAAPAPALTPPAPPEPIIFVLPPQPVPEPAPAALQETAAAPSETTSFTAPAVSMAGESMQLMAQAETPVEMLKPEPAIAPPPPPPVPRLGEKVGFIQLPAKPAPRGTDKLGSVKLPPRPGARPDPFRGRPVMGRDVRGAPLSNRPGGTPASKTESPASTVPEAPKFVPPTTGELITLKPPIIVRDLAEQLKRKPHDLIAKLMELNHFASVNQAIDEVVAQKLCAKYGYRFEVEKRERGGGVVHAPVKRVELDVDDNAADLAPRPPVVTIMGHVDHGKTTLLDVIRKSNVVAGEAGGITQHIGAYTISIPHPERPKDWQQITFLDTPGHAAFSAMRARGANVTDIVILVVAANDGVMPQTLEALSHALAAKVPIVVAVNKCDHPAANPMKVRQQLQDKGLVPEEWGGETIFQDISALTKEGVDKLLELILLQAEILELKANFNRRAKGNIIESGLEPGGPTATVLVRKGKLRVGDTVICGQYWGKVRALINEEVKRLKEAAPSVAVKILGLNGVPEAGLEFSAVENERNARMLCEQRAEEARITDKDRRPKVTLENLFATLESDAAKALKVVVKADTQGSV